MGLMEELMIYAQKEKLRPNQALDQLVTMYEKTGATNPQINLPQGQGATPNGMAPGAQGTPRMGNMGMPGQPGFQGSPILQVGHNTMCSASLIVSVCRL